MNYAPPGVTPDTTIATFITDEQTARRIAASFTDALDAEEAATSMADLGHGRWRVTFYFDGAIDEATARALANSAIGPETGRALRFERIAAKDWVADSLRELQPVAAGRFVVHGGHDRDCVPPNRIGIENGAGLGLGPRHPGHPPGRALR